ncbi:SNF2-related protein [uncultured Phascolarctobacterium sp.]|uniref:SNF2-related protein n=1 Tax=uncultured Phascolarctobacterium sp. TaxID=512296 RepID=UPI0027D94895|nr:SNF2-related protein [uncultured Phascolarctobacterium sp.]
MQLYQHQSDVLKQTEHLNKVAYYLDMGLGKTFVGSEKLKQLSENINLIICQKSKIKDWIDHLRKHYQYGVFDLTNKKQFEEFKCTIGNVIGVINYELAWRRKQLLQLENFTLMLDESSLIQNDTAKQTKFILKLKPANVILLSGTPTSGKYENLWTQAHLLGWNISKRTYENQYINYELVDFGAGFKVRTVNKKNPYKNVGRLKRKFAEHGAVFMKTDDVMDLPAQNFIVVDVKKPKVYDKFMKTSYLHLDLYNLTEFHDDSDFYGKDVTPNIELIGSTSLTKRLYARQLASQYNEYKRQAVKDLIDSTDDRLIIFYNFNEELEFLKGICKAQNRPVSEINGGCKDLYAYEQENNSVTLVQYQAGAMGVNLQKANKIIYFSLPERSELFEQSKKRTHRIGQDKPCFYYMLLAKNSVDELIYNTLLMRQDFTDELFRKEVLL